MNRKFIKGDSIDDNIDSIDLILQSWAPRLGNYVTGIIPPVPIMHYQKLPDSDGIVFGGILPFRGKITAAFLNVGKFNKKPLYIKIRILYKGVQTGVTIECEKAFNLFYPDFDVEAGSILKVAMEPIDAGEELYIGILVCPDLAYTNKERQLIEGLKLLEAQENA